jgi:hypothetical protein
MSKYDSPALFDPALFWGVALVIYFCFHKSRKGKKEKGGRTAWSYLTRIGNDLFSFFLRGFYENRPSNPAFRQKTTDNQKPTPKPLRVFAPSREQISSQAVRLCPTIVSREDAKARRWGFERLAKRHQTRPLPDKCVVLTPLCTCRLYGNARPRTCAGDHERSGGKLSSLITQHPFVASWLRASPHKVAMCRAHDF